MKNHLGLQPYSMKELNHSQAESVKLMHDQQPANLKQQIDQIILNNSDLEIVLQKLAQALTQAFCVDCCLIVVAPKNDVEPQIGYWCSDSAYSTELFQQQLLAKKTQIASKIKYSSEPLFINNIKTFEQNCVVESQHLQLPVRAVLQVPTWFQGQINGVISLIKTQPYDWSDSEKTQVVDVAPSVAIAISQIVQARLIASLQQQVYNSQQYQTLINQLTMASRSSLELNQIFNLALSGTAQALQIDRGLILTLKYSDPFFKQSERLKTTPKAKATVVCEWVNDNYPKPNTPFNQSHFPSSQLNQSFWVSECGLCEYALTTAPKPVIIPHEQATEPEREISPLFNLNLLPALIMLPLENQGTVLGFLVLQHSSDRFWNLEELALVELVSAQVSTAIIQTQTLQQVQSLVEKRTAQLKGSLEVQAKLYEKMRQQVDQLRQLNHLKDEFMGNMSDRLRHPLANMRMAIRNLRQPGLSIERQHKYLDILEQQCSQEIDLINDLLKLQQLESHQVSLNLETIDLKPRIDDLTQAFAEKWADKGLTISVNLLKSLEVRTDTESFDRIFQELLSNAGKYSQPNTTVVLKVDEQINQVVFTLTNLGRGISPEDATYIFDKFRRGQGVTDQAIKGTGLGLALVKSLVQHLNGSIDVTSKPIDQSSDWETSFTFSLPRSFAPSSTLV